MTVCGSSLVIKAAAKAFVRDHVELAICGSNLSSSLPLARRLLAGIQVLLYLLCFAVKIFINFLVAQILGDAPKAPSGPMEKQRENLIAKIGFDVGRAINSFSPELGGRQGG